MFWSAFVVLNFESSRTLLLNVFRHLLSIPIYRTVSKCFLRVANAELSPFPVTIENAIFVLFVNMDC